MRTGTERMTQDRWVNTQDSEDWDGEDIIPVVTQERWISTQ